MSLDQFRTKLLERAFPLSWPGHWIDGEWTLPSGGQKTKKTSQNPSTGEALIEIQFEKQIMLDAIASAEAQKRKIASIPMSERMAILGRFRTHLSEHRDSLKRCLRIEAGKPNWEAELDINAAIRYLDWVSTHGVEIFDRILGPARLGRTKGEFALIPIGITAAFLPFSTPVTSFVFYFGASVLAGCPLILTSSTHAVLSTMLFAHIARDLSLPKGLLNIVFGGYPAFKVAAGDNRVAAVLYTGSREHCDDIKSETRVRLGRQCIVQSGGKNAVIVHNSADMDTALRCVTYGALNSAGQRCTSTSRVFVERSLANEFTDRLTKVLQKISIGRTDEDGREPSDSVFMGPLYSEKAIEKFLRYQTMASREAESTLLWGKALDLKHGGFFVTPGLHYMNKLDNSTAYQSNVLFSPDIAVYPYDVFDDAIEAINTTDAAFVVSFIGDPGVIASVREQVLAPNLLVNMPTVEMEATLPLGGRLQAGHHRFHGPGIALYLCYPQVLDRAGDEHNIMSEWPWPKT